ncbi:hypothetical protein BJ742DRAFT_796635 [Cladochytrium replicatum]|nr:hypothetical protein BJ742DRAFT_796635 [Cladochytrium replicatum]
MSQSHSQSQLKTPHSGPFARTTSTSFAAPGVTTIVKPTRPSQQHSRASTSDMLRRSPRPARQPKPVDRTKAVEPYVQAAMDPVLLSDEAEAFRPRPKVIDDRVPSLNGSFASSTNSRYSYSVDLRDPFGVSFNNNQPRDNGRNTSFDHGRLSSSETARLLENLSRDSGRRLVNPPQRNSYPASGTPTHLPDHSYIQYDTNVYGSSNSSLSAKQQHVSQYPQHLRSNEGIDHPQKENVNRSNQVHPLDFMYSRSNTAQQNYNTNPAVEQRGRDIVRNSAIEERGHENLRSNHRRQSSSPINASSYQFYEDDRADRSFENSERQYLNQQNATQRPGSPEVFREEKPELAAHRMSAQMGTSSIVHRPIQMPEATNMQSTSRAQPFIGGRENDEETARWYANRQDGCRQDEIWGPNTHATPIVSGRKKSQTRAPFREEFPLVDATTRIQPQQNTHDEFPPAPTNEGERVERRVRERWALPRTEGRPDSGKQFGRFSPVQMYEEEYMSDMSPQGPPSEPNVSATKPDFARNASPSLLSRNLTPERRMLGVRSREPTKDVAHQAAESPSRESGLTSSQTPKDRQTTHKENQGSVETGENHSTLNSLERSNRLYSTSQLFQLDEEEAEELEQYKSELNDLFQKVVMMDSEMKSMKKLVLQLHSEQERRFIQAVTRIQAVARGFLIRRHMAKQRVFSWHSRRFTSAGRPYITYETMYRECLQMGTSDKPKSGITQSTVGALEYRSAAKIQSTVRMFLVRIRILKFYAASNAASKIQALWRGYVTRKSRPNLQVEILTRLSRRQMRAISMLSLELAATKNKLELEAKENRAYEQILRRLYEEVEVLKHWKKSYEQEQAMKAATVIQKHWRGYRARKSIPKQPRRGSNMLAQLHELDAQVTKISAVFGGFIKTPSSQGGEPSQSIQSSLSSSPVRYDDASPDRNSLSSAEEKPESWSKSTIDSTTSSPDPGTSFSAAEGRAAKGVGLLNLPRTNRPPFGGGGGRTGTAIVSGRSAGSKTIPAKAAASSKISSHTVSGTRSEAQGGKSRDISRLRLIGGADASSKSEDERTQLASKRSTLGRSASS